MFTSLVLLSRKSRESSESLLRRNSMILSLAFFSLIAHAENTATNLSDVELGRKIYLEGILPSGQPLAGKRLEQVEVKGAAAACETCHRPSGMGSLEGNIVAPPINGKFLFATEENRSIALVDIRAPSNLTQAHAPYTEESLAKAIREGVNVDGKAMSPLMPRYVLNDAEIKALSAYLRQLNAELPPGVGEDTLRFATIIAPGVDPKQKDALVKMMTGVFNQRNATQEMHSGRMRMPLDLIPRTLRNWELSVWELQGAPDTWGAQLADYYRREPVFAVISGISNTTWVPVHAFCQQEKLPCMMPSVLLPPTETGFYPFYYSRGVALEADVLGKYLRAQGKKAPRRVIQVYHDDETGRGASQALVTALRDSGIQVESRILQGQEESKLNAAVKGVTTKDIMMLWLPPADLSAVTKVIKKAPTTTYVSGFLAKEDYGFVSKSWNPQVRVVYPYELGDKRKKNTALMKQWLNSWQMPIVDEGFQTEVFFNTMFLTDLIEQMLDNLYRDYMVERAEDMLGWGSNVSAYPHLSSARGQRFASKGAYIAKLTNDGKVVPESDWIVP